MLYNKFQPTGFDAVGLGLPDRQDWIVAPVSRTRDSVGLDVANFDSCLEMLGGESETVEVHRFGHWGPGWFELILVDPSRASDVEDIESALEHYPVLDDERFAQQESDEEGEAWSFWAQSDFQRALESLFEVELDFDLANPENPGDSSYELFLTGCRRAGRYVEHHSDGPSFPIDDAVSNLTYADVESYIVD